TGTAPRPPLARGAAPVYVRNADAGVRAASSARARSDVRRAGAHARPAARSREVSRADRRARNGARGAVPDRCARSSPGPRPRGGLQFRPSPGDRDAHEREATVEIVTLLAVEGRENFGRINPVQL